jgi:diacylglycerol kinase (ATP)
MVACLDACFQTAPGFSDMSTSPTKNSQSDAGSLVLPNQPWVGVIANPFSGAGENQKRVANLTRALQDRGLVTIVKWDKKEGLELINHPNLKEYCWCLVVAGGDGTVGGVINHHLDVPMAVLPLGNENLLAKEFGYTLGEEALAEAIIRRQYSPFDVGSVNGRLFSLMLSVGIDADIVHRMQDWRAKSPILKRVGHWSYVPRIISGLRHYKYPRIDVTDDQGKKLSGVMVMVMNLPRYGLNLKFIQGVKGDDGLLDYVVLQTPGSVQSLKYFLSIWSNRHAGRKDVVFGKARGLRIESQGPAPVQIDGDPCGFTPCDVKVVPGKMKVILAPGR